MYTHSCIKCSGKYETDEADPFYCGPCDKERKAIAAEIDKKFSTIQSKRQGPSFNEKMSGLQKIPGTNISFIR